MGYAPPPGDSAKAEVSSAWWLAGGDVMDEVTVGLAALERTPMFAGLDREHLENVLAVAQRVAFEPGQAIVERGDPGDAMYIVVSGVAEVDVGGRYHRLQRGDFFGEMAVLAGKPREASVKAVEPLEALRIPADAFQVFLDANPQIAIGMLKSLVERLREVQDRLDTWIGGVW
jgi:CRP-like cAMP-binding protein